MGAVMQDPGNDSGSNSLAGRASTTSSSLLQRVQDNHAESWRSIVGLYAPLVLWWCRRKGLRDEDAQEVIQKVFKTVFMKIRTFTKDGKPGAFRRWLYSITDFKVRETRPPPDEPPAAGGRSNPVEWAPAPAGDSSEADAAWRCIFQPGHEEPAPAEDSSEADAASVRRLLVRRALEQLRDKFAPRTWEVVWRLVVEDRYPQDVAEEFGMKVGAVHKAKSVVLKRLRETLLEYEEFLS
jgi:RNA polymerase sigma factor (sigma-70 family)